LATLWLIRCSDYALVRFEGMMSRDAKDRPKYLILSHTWGDEEVIFSDMADIRAAKRKKGWGKIKGICGLARKWTYDYAWVDTCCIDKSSSAELTEAINSMYAYYEKARVCIAYLEDLEPGNDRIPTEEQLGRCRWFTRGWTLQELIAPKHVFFFDSNWGLRCHASEVLEAIESITNVDKRVLGEERRPLDEISVAQRMSWAARRTTTRIEDRAYSLMGIFGVNMPLIYGEGEGAFHRLQEAILHQSHDLSILAGKDYSLSTNLCGILAPRPEAFKWARTVELLDDPNIPAPSFIVTNAAIEMSTSLGIQRTYRNRLLHLHCTVSERHEEDSSTGTNDMRIVFLLLHRTPGGFMRVSPGLSFLQQSEVRFLESVKLTMVKRTPKLGRGVPNMYEDRLSALVIDLSGIERYIEREVHDKAMSARFSVVVTHYPEHLFVPEVGCFRFDHNSHFVGVVRIEVTSTGDRMLTPALFWLVCGTGPKQQYGSGIWATMYTGGIVESGQLADVGIYCGGDLRNPLAISNIGQCLRRLRSSSQWGETMATKQTLTMAIGTKVLRFSWSWRREASAGDDHNLDVRGWRYTIDVNATKG
ncbi:heterokaryon incompatibility protein-domain-containing protein, partial [Sordaria brevicollis]